jgi:WD40 repeat protein
MSNQGAPLVQEDGFVPFASLASLSDAHSALLKRYGEVRKDGNNQDEQFMAEVEDFIERGCATGVVLGDHSARWSAQGLVEYWAAVVFRLGGTPPETTLLAFDASRARKLPDYLCPYVGLDAFRDDKFFYGRKRVVEQLLERLKERRLLAVVGPSGSGKSSVVLGGLLPALGRGLLPGSEHWRYFPAIVPGPKPLDSLIALFLAPEGSEVKSWRTDQATEMLTRGDHLAGLIDSLCEVPAVVVVDQFEEIFTLCEDIHTRQAFLQNILSLTESTARRHTVILTMRSDYKPYVNDLNESHSEVEYAFRDAFNDAQEPVTPMDSTELREAIINPADQVGLKFEEGVVEALTQDMLSEISALPLLQFTLRKLWEDRAGDRVTMISYRLLGGGRQALERSANAVYESLIPEHREILRRIFLRMVNPTQGFDFTSRRVLLKELFRNYTFDSVKGVLQKLVETRLVRLTGSETIDGVALIAELTENNIPDEVQVEVAHEALVRNWPTFVKWLDEKRASIIKRQGLEAKAREWIRLGRGTGGLLDDIQLKEAEQWMNSPEALDLGYGESVGELVDESRKALEAARAEQEKQVQAFIEEQQHRFQAERLRADAEQNRANEEARANKFLRYFLVSAVVGVLIAVVMALYSLDRRKVAEAQRSLAMSNQLAAQSLLYTNEQIDLSLLLSLEAVSIQKNNPAALGSLIKGLELNPSLLGLLHGHSAVSSLVFTDRHDLASVDAFGNVNFWNADSRAKVRGTELQSSNLSQNTEPMIIDTPTSRLTVISPNGKLVAYSSGGGLRVRDLETGDTKSIPLGESLSVSALVFSADSKQIAFKTSTDDWAADEPQGLGIHLYEVETQMDRILPESYKAFTTIALSPDGRTVAATGEWADNNIYLWDTISAKPLPVIKVNAQAGRPESSVKIIFSNDAKRLMSAGNDGIITLWDTTTRSLIDRIRVTENAVTSLAFIAGLGGAKIGFGDAIGNMGILDLDQKQERIGRSFIGMKYSSPITDLAFSADGEILASASLDNRIALWSVKNNGQRLSRPLDPSEGADAFALAPDGQTLAVMTKGGTITIWNLKNGTKGKPLEGEKSESRMPYITHSLSFNSANSNILASDSAGGNDVLLWDVNSRELRRLRGHTAPVDLVAFSPNGEWLASRDLKGHLILWDWQVKDTPPSRTLSDSQAVVSFVFSPDSNMIASCNTTDNKILLWRVGTGELAGEFSLGPGGFVTNLAFDPEGKTLAAAMNDRTIVLLDVVKGQVINSLAGHTDWVTSLKFSKSGNRMASGSSDGTLILWDVVAQAQIAAFTEFQGGYKESNPGQRNDWTSGRWSLRQWGIADIEFTDPDGKALISLRNDRGVDIWNFDFHHWFEEACKIANRDLSEREWNTFLKLIPYHRTCPDLSVGTSAP